MLTCTILDDYQRVARSFADWDSLAGVRVGVPSEHLLGADLVSAIADSEILVIMRERHRSQPSCSTRCRNCNY
jgi:hypothetical protein